MPTTEVDSFSDLQDTFLSYMRDIKYATMITVDRKNRPRVRVLFPVWEIVDGRPVGWLASYRTPVKAAHLAHSPHTTYSYWNPCQNTVHIDALSTWAEQPVVARGGTAHSRGHNVARRHEGASGAQCFTVP